MKKQVIIVALITGIVLVLMANANLFYTWNQRLTDGLYGGGTPIEDIIIIAIDDKSLQEIGRWPWQRTAYIPLLEQTKNANVVAFDIGFFESTKEDATLGDAMRKAGNVIIAQEYDYTRKTVLTPVAGFEGIQTGWVNIYTDRDGTNRRIPTTIKGTPSLAHQITSAFLGRPPTTPETVLINFAGGPESYTLYSATDVINKRIPPEAFDNALVLIGATAPDLHDDYIVPTSEGTRMPGVEIHAHAAQTMMTKSWLQSQSTLSLGIIILLLALLAGFVYASVKIRYAAPILFGVLIAYIVFAIYTFKQGTILNLVYPPITIIATSLTTMSYLYSTEVKHKKYVVGIFGRYVSKDVVEHLLKSEKAIELGGKEQIVTALFADIRGFTAMSEKMTPHQVIELLNHYFGDMTDLVFEHDGTLDKFIGDCLFALWGTPIEDEEHALKAVRCCLAIQKKLKEKHDKDIPPISLGMGLCSGPAVVGNMGSTQRQEFTAIGDTINTASRLSGQAQGGEIIISETTYNLVKDHVKVKKLKPVKVKGKEKPLTIYEVLE